MNLKQIIREELEAKEWVNFMELMKSPDLDNVALALNVAPYQDCEEQFKREFGMSIEEYTDMFDNLILPVSKISNLEEEFKKLLTLIEFDAVYVNSLKLNIFYNILKYLPETYKYFNFKGANILYCRSLFKTQPQLIKYFDYSKLDGGDIALMIIENPDLIDVFDLTKLYTDNIVFILSHQPQLVDSLAVIKLSPNEVNSLLSKQPQLKPYFDKLNKGNINETLQRTKINMFF